MKTLRLIMGDQLNRNHSWFKQVDEQVIYCLFETRQDTDYIRHHIQRLLAFFAALRDLAKFLQSEGHRVVYLKIDDLENKQTLTENLSYLIEKHNIEKFEYQQPDKFGLDKRLKAFCDYLSIASKAYGTEHFLSERDELEEFFDGKKQFLMESFYRYMRKKHDILMDGKNPEGGQWNYDHNNRKKWKARHEVPPLKRFKNDISDIKADLDAAEVITFGRLGNSESDFPLNPEQASQLLTYFCNELLIHFGDYQD
ncbi:MAG: cryptochrome/photolyase family protein, partial [Flavobacteriaceae bacterium]|nr:cryptochrome/photolyase family protein [Flavobacteriaceae bacterium]